MDFAGTLPGFFLVKVLLLSSLSVVTLSSKYGFTGGSDTPVAIKVFICSLLLIVPYVI